MRSLAFFGAGVAFTIWMFLSAIFNGYVLSVMWGWFIVPTLGLSPITTVPAIGLALVVGYLTHHEIDCQPSERTNYEKVVYAVVNSLIYPAIALAIGWVVHLFM